MSADWIQVEVSEVKKQTSMLFSVKLAPAADDLDLHFQAGQCVNVLTAANRKSGFSIANEPEEKKFIEFLLKDQPDTTAHELCGLKAGARIKISPPFGKGFPVERFKHHDLLLVGIGSGLSPLRSLIRSILRKEHHFKQISLFYGARTQQDIPFRDEFDVWAKKIHLQIALSQPDPNWLGFKGRVTDLISATEINSKDIICCICGTKEMEGQVRKILETKGVSKENILLNY